VADRYEKEDPVGRIRRLVAEMEQMPPSIRRAAERMMEAQLIAGRPTWQPPLLHQLYFGMVDRWQEIVRQPVPRAAKQEACLALLIDLVDQIAEARVGQVNAPLRFFADMAQLKSYLMPHSAHDELGHIAIRPSFQLVSDWLLDNAHADRTKSAGGPINIVRYMAVHSEYVQAILRRVIGPT